MRQVGHGRVARRHRVSIHAPGRGATSSLRSISCPPKVFQFTHPGGVRRTLSGRKEVSSNVSIHAPGRGATGRETFQCHVLGVSIHAPGRGATTHTPSKTARKARFNSRTREGCDGSGSGFYNVTTESFNSRTREGCDRFVLSIARGIAKFQFTHPGGVRQS